MRIFGQTLTAAALVAASLGLGGCASLQPQDFANSTPTFQPEAYFAGRTRSWGVFETPGGAPASQFTGDTVGRREPGGTVSFEQSVAFDDGTRLDRSWRLTRIDEHHLEATGTDVVGVVKGEIYGRVLHLAYTVRTEPGNALSTVDFEQWMYLQDDGVTVLNRSIIRKFGFVVRMATERFVRSPERVGSRVAARGRIR